MLETAFLDAIRETPDDDTPRLIFADWLDDHGQEARAEFIRLHVAWCREPDETLKPRLLAAWEAAGLRDDTGVYDRGFPAVAWFEDFEHVAREAEPTFRTHPIRVMYLHQDSTYGDDTSPWQRVREAATWLRGLVGLGCDSNGWPQAQQVFLTLPELAGLEMLDFHGCYRFDTPGAEAIANATHLTNLRVLDLCGCQIGDEGLEALANAPHLGGLHSLRLGVDHDDSDNALSARGVAALTRSPYLRHLTQLSLNCNGIGDVGLGELLQWPHLANLTELDLGCCHLNEAGLLRLAQAPTLTNLRRLDLSVNGTMTPALVDALVRSELPDLCELHLSPGDVAAAHLESLRARFPRLVLADLAMQPATLGEADRICARVRRAERAPTPSESRIL